MPTGPPGSTQGCNCSTYTAVSTRSQRGQHAGKNWTGRQNALEQKKTCNRHESNPTSSPGLQQAGAPEFVRKTDDTTRRAGRNATWFPHHPDDYFYSWNHPRGKTKEEHWKLTTSHMGRANRLAGLRLKKQNKTKKPRNTQCCKQPFSSTSDDQYCKSWTVDKIQTPSSLPQRGPARWVTFPRGGSVGGMSFWQVSLSTHFLSPPPTGLQPEAREEKW